MEKIGKKIIQNEWSYPSKTEKNKYLEPFYICKVNQHSQFSQNVVKKAFSEFKNFISRKNVDKTNCVPLDRWGAPDALSNGSFGLGIMSTVEGRFRDKDNWIWIRKHKYIKQQPKSNNLSIRGLFILSMQAGSLFLAKLVIEAAFRAKNPAMFFYYRGEFTNYVDKSRLVGIQKMLTFCHCL